MRIALVGEAPGSEEDLQGIPFVGKSGQLLTQMLESIGIERRRDIAIMNVLKCRPPGNRNPAPAEVACCATYLRRQLLSFAPTCFSSWDASPCRRCSVWDPTLDRQPARRVHDVTIGDFDTKAVVSYHPSYLLRAPDEKAKAWEDLTLFRRLIREAGIKPRSPSITHTDNKDGVFPQWRKDAEEAVVILHGRGPEVTSSMTNNNEVRDAVSPDRTLYDRALRASGREAAATLAAAAFTMAYFWAAVWLLEDSDMTILSMPVWFMASCVGGYFVSVAAVWVLVKRCSPTSTLMKPPAVTRQGT